LGYKGWFLGSLISQFVAFICYLKVAFYYNIVKFNFKFNLKWILKYLKISLPVIPHTYSSFLMETSDRIILSIFLININIIGIYNIGYTFGQYFNILNIGLALATSAFYLKLYNNYNKDNEVKVRNITIIVGSCILVLAAIAGLWMKEIFSIFIRNQNLRDGFSITIVILFSYVGNVFYMSSGNKLIAFGKMNHLWKVSLIAGLINVILNLILIPYLNIWGSVIATLVGNSYLHFRI
jgi:O-antigen/teichoic acid export membrane protein